MAVPAVAVLISCSRGWSVRGRRGARWCGRGGRGAQAAAGRQVRQGR
ncbi:hypothetical protein Ae168Ps1_1865c [Pseudonocardia sp. Ae168_Ps1]|nr:hypothetical protein Ae168Ps1_1865c [Pseudonocardia sp. Ae168_Ps1]